MRRISSRTTFFNKRIFPLLWFGLLSIGFMTGIFNSIKKHETIQFQFALIPLGMAIFGYLIMRELVFDLMDGVWDAGDVLIIKKKNKEDQIQLSDIMNISYSNFSNPQRVTLTLRKPCCWGTEITFSPLICFSPFKKNTIVQDLIERVDAKRRG